MITNFETITNQVTEVEKALIPYIVMMFKEGKKNAITNEKIRENLKNSGKGDIKDFRLRVLIHFMRYKGHSSRLCSSSRGYYIGTLSECAEYIKSLEERMDSIGQIKEALRAQAENTRVQLSMAI